ncbi:hypothetical protein TNCV_2118641 [Trichonephila clavipes]|nr:hypothetical protein TNCV_2118641 [Trichonephila clavipes]
MYPHEVTMGLCPIHSMYPQVVTWNISSSFRRNQTTVMRIYDRWMQEGATDRRGRSYPPQCTTLRLGQQRIIQCLRVPFDAIFNRVVCPQGVHCLVYP